MAKMKTSFRHICLYSIMLLSSFSSSAQWEFVGCPERLSFVDIVWDGNFIYTATSGGLYYSNDNGSTWHAIADNTPFIEVKSVEVIEHKIYVKADSYIRSDQLFVSEDGGLTWRDIEMYENYGTFLNDFVVRGDTMIMAVHPWFFVSFDGGRTIAHTYSTNATGFFGALYWVGKTLIGSPYSGNGYWRSEDMGEHWTKVDESFRRGFKMIGQTLWSIKFNDITSEYTYSLSTDEGVSWKDKLTVPTTPVYYNINFFGDEHDIFLTWSSNSTNKIYHSTDLGETWPVTNADLQYKSHIAWLNTRLFAWQTSTIVSSTDLGKTWKDSKNGIHETGVGPITLPGHDVIWLSQDVSRDGGISWTTFPDSIYAVATSGNGHMVGLLGENIFISDDTGLTWTFVKHLNLNLSNHAARVYYLGGKFIINYVVQGELTYSADGGLTWTDPQYYSEPLMEIRYNQGKYYSEVSPGRITISDDLINWQDVTYNLYDLYVNSQIEGLIVHDSNVILYNWDMYRLDLHDQEWKTSPYLTETKFQRFNYPVVEEMRSYDDIILAACNGLGVYLSYDTGYSWVPFNDGLGNLRANSIEFDDQYIYLGMASGGLWRRPIEDLNHYNIIHGQVFFDDNQNGVRDTLESPLPDVTVFSKQSKVFVQSRNAGEFTLYTNSSGIDTIEARPPYTFAHATTPPIEVSGNADSLEFGIYFEKIYDAGIDITEVTPARPGFEFCIVLTRKNKSGLPSDMTVVFYPDDKVVFDSADVHPESIHADSIVWNIKDLKPGEEFRIKLSFYVPTDLLDGTKLHFRSVIIPEETDIYPDDNSAILDVVTVGSYDPNDKNVFPAGDIAPELIADTMNLVYTIRFQNVGTYRADNIRIVDTLSQLLDINSFHMITGSHEFTWRLRKGRVLEIFFQNIFLPDETSDEQGSHGFIKYSINLLPSVKVGENITNRADIYFDYNQPVATNQTESLVKEISVDVDEPVGLNEIECALHITPNPATNTVEINIPDFIAMPAKLSIFDNDGRLLMTGKVHNVGRNQLDISGFPSGILNLVVSDQKIRCGGTVVKMK